MFVNRLIKWYLVNILLCDCPLVMESTVGKKCRSKMSGKGHLFRFPND